MSDFAWGLTMLLMSLAAVGWGIYVGYGSGYTARMVDEMQQGIRQSNEPSPAHEWEDFE